MKKLIAAMLSAAALAVALPAGASAAPSDNACFGQAVRFTATNGAPGAVGSIVSDSAQAPDGAPGNGQDFIPIAKGLFCP